jgi:hypothetical protein
VRDTSNSPAGRAPDRRGIVIFAGIAAAITLFKLWLDTALRVRVEAFQIFDDALYVRSALAIIEGQWLGPFDHLTLAKNPGYPIWLALNHVIGSPLLVAQSALYAGAGLLLAREILLAGYARWPLLAVYVAYLFNPFVEIRVMREGIYGSLLVLTFAALANLHRRVMTGRRILASAFSAGAAIAAVWVTREEGAATLLGITPLAFAIAALALRVSPRRAERLGRAARALAVPAVTALVFVTCCSFANLSAYGVFRLNEQGSRPFTDAMGSLLRVEHERPTQYLLVPAEVRRRVYAESAAFASLEPFLDGYGGALALRRGWIRGTCELYPATCPDYGGAWMTWAFRQAVRDAGFYESATKADDLYRRISAEIDVACDAGRLRCAHKTSSAIAPFRSAYVPQILQALWSGFDYVLDVPIRRYVYDADARSNANGPGLVAFANLTNSGVLPLYDERASEQRGGAASEFTGAAPLAAPKLEALQFLGRVYGTGLRWLVIAGVTCFTLSAAVSLRRREFSLLFVLNAALAASVFVRLALLCYIDITMFPAFTRWPAYITPLYPLLILFSGLAVLDAWHRAVASRSAVTRARAAQQSEAVHRRPATRGQDRVRVRS